MAACLQSTALQSRLIETYVGWLRAQQPSLTFSMKFQEATEVAGDGDKYATTIGESEDNASKNRYFNIIPYDRTRVTLKNSCDNSDYINASIIEAKDTGVQYIATQGPLPNTFGDFWQMIFEKGCRVIVMLTQEVEKRMVKCHRYWPDDETAVKHGNISVKLKTRTEVTYKVNLKRDVLAIKRILAISDEVTGSQREISHLQFLKWSDHGVPSHPQTVLLLRDLMNTEQTLHPNPGPLVIHCSAGCGRTGTLCAIDSTIHLMEAEKFADGEDVIVNVVRRFNEQRTCMVQTVPQFTFIYETVVYYWQTHRSSKYP